MNTLTANPEPLPSTRQLDAKILFAAMKTLKQNGGDMAMKDLLQALKKTVSLDACDTEAPPETSSPRWQTNLKLFGIDYVKAGFVVRSKGHWYLTEQGREGINSRPGKSPADGSKGRLQNLFRREIICVIQRF